MLFLHISDIHFRSPDCEGDMDPERPYRTALLNDARVQRNRLGDVDAILITGDIAFQGLASEYLVAEAWIADLCFASGCSLRKVFVVPGNHDVDRTSIANSQDVRDSQNKIFSADSRERELRRQLLGVETGPILFRPLAAYNEFAAKFNCQTFPGRPYWRQELELDDQLTLRIYGLTSTFLSGVDGKDDERGRLFMGPMQTVLDPVPNTINFALAHHPPDWLSDGDDVEDALNGRAVMQAFGHKHRQRITRENGYVRLAAGAVNPERHLPGWQPGYNLIRLTPTKINGRSHLEIEAHVRSWQTAPDQFVAKLTQNGQDAFPHSIALWNVVERQRAATVPAAAPAVADPEVAMSEPSSRNLVWRFWKLKASDRRDISLRLELMTVDDLKLPEAERYGKALIAASERGLLHRVTEEIEKAERKNGQD
jgi:3',5'-cyclic AMP phosphodiesterase CpdA